MAAEDFYFFVKKIMLQVAKNIIFSHALLDIICVALKVIERSRLINNKDECIKKFHRKYQSQLETDE